eukprot:XP_011673057.1 PREDICTED: uncharacterized protein LOC105442548 [Strongylocentrotus purpuratus]
MDNYFLSIQRDETTPLVEDHLFDSSSIESSTCYPQSNKIRLKSRWRDNYPLPSVVQVTLGLLGLWSPLRRTHSPSTISQYPNNIEEVLTNKDDRDQGEDSDDGSTQEYVDKNGKRYDYSHDSVDAVGDRPRKARAKDRNCWVITSNICAFSYLLLSCCLMTYDFQRYMGFYWGKKEEVLHLVSYFTYLFQIMVIPFWCFYARILYLTLGRRYREGYPLCRSFISTRVAILRNSRFGAKGLSWFRLIFFLAWPVTNAMLRFANDYYFRYCSFVTLYKEITHWCAFLGYIFYGCFCYLIYIERLSFECEVHQISAFAREQASGKNIDQVRRRISRFYAQYNVLRRLIRTWMAFTMVVATWGLTAHILWNYLVFSDKNIDLQNLPILRSLNVVVSSQKIMFFVVPCVAIGGLNLEHVWKRFRNEIAKHRQHVHDGYWTAINRYLHEINVDHSGDLTPTLIFSAIGFYLGHMGDNDQEHTRWNYPPADCNHTR